MLNQKIGLAVLLAACAAGDAMAQSTLTNYNTGDVLLCFRQPGNLDLVVDIGQISTFQALAPNSRTVISAYTGTQLGQLATNSISWSAFTYTSDNTRYMPRPRPASGLNSQTTPWLEASSANQANTALRIGKIPPGAAGNYGAGLNNAHSTATSVIEQDSSAGNPNYPSGLSYHDALFGSYGTATWNGTFQGSPENTTPASFTADGVVQRSDFYQITPNSRFGLAQALGYFELNTNGVMTYVAYPSTPAVVSNISRNNGTGVNTITYSTGAHGTYSLRGTNNIAAPVSTWPVLQTLSNSANGATCTDTTTDGNRFYTITAQ